MEKERLYTMIDEAEGRRRIAMPAVMRKVYVWMTMALAITGITAFGVANSPNLLALIFGNSIIFWGLFIGELALVMWLSLRLHKLSITTATMMFIAYSVLNGVVLSSVLLVYTMSSVATTFFICAATFGVMSVFGIVTKSDLSGMGKILLMALIGLIIATVVNIFVASSGLQMILNYVGVLIFVGLTAWDTQKIKLMLADADMYDESAQKVALMGALTLYLDFINLFLHLLRLLGNSRD